MKKFLFILTLFTSFAFAAAPPLLRNKATTNAEPVANSLAFPASSNLVAGGSHTVSGGGSNIIVSARNATILASEHCGIFASHPESTVINNAQNCVIVGGAAVEIHNTVESAIVSATHSSIGGMGGGGNNGNNFIGGGGGIYMGDEFSSDAIWASASLGGESVTFGSTAQWVGLLAVREVEVSGATNGVVVGGFNNKLQGLGGAILGGINRTNSGNWQVLIGMRGRGLIVETNSGVTAESSLLVQGPLSVTGNITNTGTLFLQPTADWTNWLSGGSQLLEERYSSGRMSYVDSDEFTGGDIYSISGGGERKFHLHVEPVVQTNAAPGGVTVGTTAVKKWIPVKDEAGNTLYIPAY